jgi:hypothetical protein
MCRKHYLFVEQGNNITRFPAPAGQNENTLLPVLQTGSPDGAGMIGYGLGCALYIFSPNYFKKRFL